MKRVPTFPNSASILSPTQWEVLNEEIDSAHQSEIKKVRIWYKVVLVKIENHEVAVTLFAQLAVIGNEIFNGIRDPEQRHYELDYMMDPELGGSDDARNLWPQPYSVREKRAEYGLFRDDCQRGDPHCANHHDEIRRRLSYRSTVAVTVPEFCIADHEEIETNRESAHPLPSVFGARRGRTA